MKKIKILIAAGGTGGHLFPALAVVEQLKANLGDSIDFEFFGRTDKIEGKIVPQLGYHLHETNLSSWNKNNLLSMLKLPFTMLSDIFSMYCLLMQKKFDAVICAGAYLSIPPGVAANLAKKKLFLLESNVNPGKAIKFLTNKADIIFTSFEETETFFKLKYINKLKCLGNPVRNSIIKVKDKAEARYELGLDNEKPVIFIFGGSLGAKSINEAVIKHLDEFEKSDYQVIWQTGNSYEIPKNIKIPDNVKSVSFIHNMDIVYSAADLVVSRSGATTIAELCVLGKPSILVPLPSASNNEQYYNAKELEKNHAAVLIKNENIGENLYKSIYELINDGERLGAMRQAALSLSRPNASKNITDVIISYICQK